MSQNNIVDNQFHKPYVPLKVVKHEVVGFYWAFKAMRLPKMSGHKSDTIFDHDLHSIISYGPKDLSLISNLVKGGDDHAKAVRGIIVYVEIELQVGFMIEFETYRHGIECLSTSSSMHIELKDLHGEDLANQKQRDLPDKVYVRILTASYQALRHMYKARRYHKHPDWQIICDWIETLPLAKELILI